MYEFPQETAVKLSKSLPFEYQNVSLFLTVYFKWSTYSMLTCFAGGATYSFRKILDLKPHYLYYHIEQFPPRENRKSYEQSTKYDFLGKYPKVCFE